MRLTFVKHTLLLYHIIRETEKKELEWYRTEKISDETVKCVQQALENSGYIPNMAGILLAKNNSRIIGVVVNDHEKYEGRVLEDGFVKLIMKN